MVLKHWQLFLGVPVPVPYLLKCSIIYSIKRHFYLGTATVWKRVRIKIVARIDLFLNKIIYYEFRDIQDFRRFLFQKKDSRVRESLELFLINSHSFK